MNFFNKIIIFTFSSLLFLASLPARSQTSSAPLSLDECIQYALENSLQIEQSRLDQKKASAQIGEVRSSGLPQVSGSASLQDYVNIPTQVLPGEIAGQPGTQIPVQFGTKFNVSAGVEATQLLYNQEYFTGLKAARTTRELYELQGIDTHEDVIYNTAAYYYQALQLDQQLENIENNLSKLTELEKLMKAQYENDLITKTEYSRLLVNKTNLQTQKQSLTASKEQQVNYLKLLIGMPVNVDLQLEKDNSKPDLSALNLDAEEQVDIKLLKKQKELISLENSSISAGYAPTLSAFAQHNYNAMRNEFNFLEANQPWFETTIIGLQLQIPIFDGLKKHYRSQQSQISLRQLDIDLETVKRRTSVELENARTQLTNSLKSVQAQEENVKLAEEVYDQTQELYQSQVASLTELLDSETALREARTGYNTEILKFKLAELNLIKAQGQLTKIVE